MGILKKILNEEEEEVFNGTDGEAYYDLKAEEIADQGNKMILLEPRAFSEAQQIADHLKKRNTVVVNLKRVTSDQAKRIVDFLSGTIYAINGELQKIGGGIFLCTPKNITVQGKITDESAGKGIHDNKDINVEW